KLYNDISTITFHHNVHFWLQQVGEQAGDAHKRWQELERYQYRWIGIKTMLEELHNLYWRHGREMGLPITAMERMQETHIFWEKDERNRVDQERQLLVQRLPLDIEQSKRMFDIS